MECAIEVRRFISDYHPEIEIEDIEFEYLRANGKDYPGPGFFTEETEEMFEKGEEDMDGIWVTFRFRDHGAKLTQKDIEFRGSFSICDNLTTDLSLRCKVPVCEEYPDYTFSARADQDGRFSLTFTVLFRKAPATDGEKLLSDLKNHNAFFSFHNVVIANQFVAERMEYINGRFPNVGEKAKVWITRSMYAMSGISKNNNIWVLRPENEENENEKS